MAIATPATGESPATGGTPVTGQPAGTGETPATGPPPRIVVPAAPDLATCDREPIHIPGTIQPHGVLVGLAAADLSVSTISLNLCTRMGRSPEQVLGKPLGRLVDAATRQAIAAASDASIRNNAQPIYLNLPSLDPGDPPGTRWRGRIHASQNQILLEVETSRSDSRMDAATLFEPFHAAAGRVQQARSVAETCTRLAQEVRRLTGYDRVKVYRFARDWSGEVLAEDRDPSMPSFLGLHFPASDIPAQARALYVRYEERQIPSIGYTPVPLLQIGADPTDLSLSVLRAVSPMHIAYLRNMEVGASMSVSILRDGALWGLVACHHRTAHYLPPELRQACVVLTQLAALQLAAAEQAETAHSAIAVRAIEGKLLRETTPGTDFRAALLRHGGELLGLLRASGMALSSGSSVLTLGETPAPEHLAGLIGWLRTRAAALYHTDHLGAAWPAASGPGAAGILSVPVDSTAQRQIIWFRPEIARSVTWAGNPAKPVEAAPGTPTRLAPRASFTAWTEEVRGRSHPWEPHELAVATGLRDVVADIILRHSLELERINGELQRANEELEAFTYVASHDLKEPLRQIETFGTLLERAFTQSNARQPNTAVWFDGIQASSRRLRSLIDDLAAYSRLGRDAHPFAPVSLARLVDDVRSDLGSLIDDARATLSVGPLPDLVCDATQMRLVLQNLISNAVKYRDPARPPTIDISATITPPPGPTQVPELPTLTLRVRDNGIGFEERFRDRIFEPFQRLHSADEYGGSGIGLATCRKIVNRHGGRISAASRPGEGSVFTITLPMRPVADEPGATR